LRLFDQDESNALERFVFEESCRLEQTAALLTRAQEFLKERRVIFPAESALLRLVAEQKKLAHESIVTRIADSLSPDTSAPFDWENVILYGQYVIDPNQIR
jgi:hypothetical protein